MAVLLCGQPRNVKEPVEAAFRGRQSLSPVLGKPGNTAPASMLSLSTVGCQQAIMRHAVILLIACQIRCVARILKTENRPFKPLLWSYKPITHLAHLRHALPLLRNQKYDSPTFAITCVSILPVTSAIFRVSTTCSLGITCKSSFAYAAAVAAARCCQSLFLCVSA
jgi:hypothetical protein